MPNSLETNSATTLDWLEVSKHMPVSLTFNCDPVQVKQDQEPNHVEERAFGSHISEAASTVKKLLPR
jgi:hypothetical protein